MTFKYGTWEFLGHTAILDILLLAAIMSCLLTIWFPEYQVSKKYFRNVQLSHRFNAKLHTTCGPHFNWKKSLFFFSTKHLVRNIHYSKQKKAVLEFNHVQVIPRKYTCNLLRDWSNGHDLHIIKVDIHNSRSSGGFSKVIIFTNLWHLSGPHILLGQSSDISAWADESVQNRNAIRLTKE